MTQTLLMKGRSLVLMVLLFVVLSGALVGGVSIEDAFANPGDNPWPVID
jgi:hypothetical protein